jgi:hypothetical protein
MKKEPKEITLEDAVEDYLFDGKSYPFWKEKIYWPVRRFFSDIWFNIINKYQRLTNKGISNNDIYNLYDILSVYIYPRLVRFIELAKETKSNPHHFEKDQINDLEQYIKDIIGDSVENEAWVKVLEEMLFGFEHMVLEEAGSEETEKKFYDKWFGKSPYDKTEENKLYSYCYRTNDPDCDHVSSSVRLSDEECEARGYTLYKIRYTYLNMAFHEEVEKRIDRSLKLFGEFYRCLWD